MIILSIDTSCDETSVAITEGHKVLANVIYSQVLLHKEWGGVVPSIAKRAHEERINLVVEECFKKFDKHQTDLAASFKKIDYIAVTQGPGLAIALEVGIKKAKELAVKYKKKLISVNHLEGHIYSVFVQNSAGNPKIKIEFPFLSVIVSGGHTEIVLMKDHLIYEVLGETLDDAAGEALDKAAKLLGLGYPGGPVIEAVAKEVGNIDLDHFPRPMMREPNFNMSYSGLKTAFYYHLKKMSEVEKNKQIKTLVSSFQEAVFDVLIKKTEKVIKKIDVRRLVVGGGVIANKRLKNLFRSLMKKNKGNVLFPPYKYLTGDNASMIGVVAYYKVEKKYFVENLEELDRLPRMSLASPTS